MVNNKIKKNYKVKTGLLCGLLAAIMLLTSFCILSTTGEKSTFNGSARAANLPISTKADIEFNDTVIRFWSTATKNNYELLYWKATSEGVLLSIDDILKGSSARLDVPLNSGGAYVTFDIKPFLEQYLLDYNTTYSFCVVSRLNVINVARSEIINSSFISTVTLPETPVKEGYTFVGWYLDEALTQPYNNEPIYEDTALYAKFKINTYTVTFDSNGGSAVATQTINWNTVANLTDPVKEGYTFMGWLLGGVAYNNAPVKSNIKLTAKWQINTHTVTFFSAGGSAVAPQTINWGTIPTLSTPVKEGHTFVGWYVGETQYIATAIKSNLALTAKWEINKYTITFDSVGGSLVDSQTIDWNTSVLLNDDPIRAGHIFKGWYIGDVKYANAPIVSDTTLIAKWEIMRFTVTFIVDGVEYKSVEVNYGTTFQEAMAKASLQYNMLLNSHGEAIGKGGLITENVTVPIGDMTQEEKVATFIGNNWWLLIVGGSLMGVLIITSAIAIVIARKRR